MERITLERTACFGPCPVYTTTIERNGHATFRATRFPVDARDRIHEAPIEWHAQVPDDALRALITAVESPAYAGLEDDYSVMVMDYDTTILTVTDGGVVRRTVVHAVPCRKHMPAHPGEHLAGVEPVPDIFCSVVDLVDVASCARYWAYYSRVTFSLHGKNARRLPPRCKPMP